MHHVAHYGRRAAFACSLAVALALAAASFAQSTPAVEEGFTPLFNGRDLTGWVYGGSEQKPDRTGKGYQVTPDGVLFCTKEDGGKLYTEKEYADFAFRFEFKLEPNSNNGIAVRSPREGDPAYVAMEIQVLDDGGSEYKSLRPEQYHGSIYDVVAAKRGHQKPVGEWNEEEIRVQGSRVTVTLNGKVIVDANLDEVTDEAVLKKHPGLKNKKGRLGFLGHGTRVEFRNVRIREL